MKFLRRNHGDVHNHHINWNDNVTLSVNKYSLCSKTTNLNALIHRCCQSIVKQKQLQFFLFSERSLHLLIKILKSLTIKLNSFYSFHWKNCVQSNRCQQKIVEKSNLVWSFLAILYNSSLAQPNKVRLTSCLLFSFGELGKRFLY